MKVKVMRVKVKQRDKEERMKENSRVAKYRETKKETDEAKGKNLTEGKAKQLTS